MGLTVSAPLFPGNAGDGEGVVYAKDESKPHENRNRSYRKRAKPMEAVSPRIQQWIKEGKDPRVAHWQGGLEAVLKVLLPCLEPGRLTPAAPLTEAEWEVFARSLAVVDLSPNLHAAFLPDSIAGKINPPPSAEKLQRVDGTDPSLKLLIERPGAETRILCVELSDRARKTGVDIFQGGALLGTYDFEGQEDCFDALNKIIRTHIWEKGKWRREDHVRYTVNWFEKVLDLPGREIRVEKDRSFLHSPTLIRSKGMDAMFALLMEVFMKRAGDAESPVGSAAAAIRALHEAGIREARARSLAETCVFEYLAALKKCGAVRFDTFSEQESERFDRECDGIVRRMAAGVISA